MTTQSSNDKEEYNGTTTIQPRTDATTLPRDTTAVDDNNNELVAIHNIDDIDENDLADDIIEEDYDRYIELIQHHHGEGRPAPTASAAMAAHFQQQSSERHNNNNNHTDYFMDHHHNNCSNNDRVPLDLEDTTMRDDHEATNLNMCSAYTHVFADTLRSIAVIIAAIIAEVVPSITPEVADSTAAILVSILILLSLYPLVQGLISSCQELHAIYKEEQIESATSSLVTMHSSTEPADHFEMT